MTTALWLAPLLPVAVLLVRRSVDATRQAEAVAGRHWRVGPQTPGGDEE